MSLGVHTMQPSTSDQLSSSSTSVVQRAPSTPRTAAWARPRSTSATPSQADARQLADRRQVHAGDESGADDADAERHRPNTSRAAAAVAPGRRPRRRRGRRTYAGSSSGASLPNSNRPRSAPRRTTSRTIGSSGKRRGQLDDTRSACDSHQARPPRATDVPGPPCATMIFQSGNSAATPRQREVPLRPIHVDLQRSPAPRHLAQQRQHRAAEAVGAPLQRQCSLAPTTASARYAASMARQAPCQVIRIEHHVCRAARHPPAGTRASVSALPAQTSSTIARSDDATLASIP